MLITISDKQEEEDSVSQKQPVTLPIVTMRTIICEFSLRTHQVEPNWGKMKSEVLDKNHCQPIRSRAEYNSNVQNQKK